MNADTSANTLPWEPSTPANKQARQIGDYAQEKAQYLDPHEDADDEVCPLDLLSRFCSNGGMSPFFSILADIESMDL
jgi:hypothetical protein